MSRTTSHTSDPIKTSDLDAASYLLLRGLPLLGVERGHRTTFVFPGDAQAALLEFYGGKPLVSPQDFGAALRAAKKAIHDAPEYRPDGTTTTTKEIQTHGFRRS